MTFGCRVDENGQIGEISIFPSIVTNVENTTYELADAAIERW
jgi:exoribonuclease R